MPVRPRPRAPPSPRRSARRAPVASTCVRFSRTSRAMATEVDDVEADGDAVGELQGAGRARTGARRSARRRSGRPAAMPRPSTVSASRQARPRPWRPGRRRGRCRRTRPPGGPESRARKTPCSSSGHDELPKVSAMMNTTPETSATTPAASEHRPASEGVGEAAGRQLEPEDHEALHREDDADLGQAQPALERATSVMTPMTQPDREPAGQAQDEQDPRAARAVTTPCEAWS